MHPVATGQDTVADPLEKLIPPYGGGGGGFARTGGRGRWKGRNTSIGILHQFFFLIWLWVWPLDPPSLQVIDHRNVLSVGENYI